MSNAQLIKFNEYLLHIDALLAKFDTEKDQVDMLRKTISGLIHQIHLRMK